jgi:hypothetical protein
MNTENDQPVNTEEAEKAELNKRLEAIGWGLFLIMIGGLWLIPDAQVPEGTWLIGAGVIMLGLNLARYMNHIKTSRFTIVLGTIALLIGFSDYLGADLPLVPILIILVGANMIYGVLTRRD